MAIKTGGSVNVTSNTEPFGHTVFTSGALLTVSSGGVVKNVTNAGGTAVIAGGGYAYISSGFTAKNLSSI